MLAAFLRLVAVSGMRSPWQTSSNGLETDDDTCCLLHPPSRAVRLSSKGPVAAVVFGALAFLISGHGG